MKWTYLCSGHFLAIFDNFISDSACEKLRFTIFEFETQWDINSLSKNTLLWASLLLVTI